MIRTIVLVKNNFTGEIPPSISNLTYLERLFLGDNPLGGSIPDSFNQLKCTQRNIPTVFTFHCTRSESKQSVWSSSTRDWQPEELRIS
ncbi:putative leucine-rich repeat domain superfamily [Helianthus annuus]|nr:putative leucine-rich repeat domain superfamily [Helianthus annuus]